MHILSEFSSWSKSNDFFLIYFTWYPFPIRKSWNRIVQNITIFCCAIELFFSWIYTCSTGCSTDCSTSCSTVASTGLLCINSFHNTGCSTGCSSDCSTGCSTFRWLERIWQIWPKVAGDCWDRRCEKFRHLNT